jgi:hypothetical protein
MNSTLSPRKPVHKLKIADFRQFPVWEYAIDEESMPDRDETWVRPVDCQFVRRGVYSQIVAAEFTTFSGNTLKGFMNVNTADRNIEVLPGVILGRVRYIVIPALSRKLAARRYCDRSIRERDDLVRALGQPESMVFPMKYALLALVGGEKILREGILK